MQQLAHALRQAGFRPTPELKAERDRAIGALVKARRQKRRGAKALKARVLALVSALRIPAPVVMLLVLVAMPSLALAHPGHGQHVGMPPTGQLVGIVAVTLGLAAHAWATWGPRRRLVASIDGGELPAPGGSFETGPDEHGLPRYYTVRIPYVAPERATEWHPTEPTGPWSMLTRGTYNTIEAARAWADAKLGGTPYTVAHVRFDMATDREVVTTVYTSEGK